MPASIWSDFLASIPDFKAKNPVLYSMLGQLRLTDTQNDVFVLSTDNQGHASFLQRRVEELELLLSQRMNRNIKIRFTLHEKKHVERENPLFQFEPNKDDLFRRAGLNPVYTFDNFAVSSTNQIAYAAAQAIAEEQSRAYNPLVLYGGVGVGKTHLSQAAARRMLEMNMDRKVCFSTSEHFMNELIESIQQRTTAKFRAKYRKLDVLIVDDIQFIAGKNTAQEEFFHTFNSVVSSGGQIILTSDRPPAEIQKLEDRLRSRFSGGLMVDVQPADFELRAAILMIKAREKRIPVDIDVAKLIAEQIADARALEGALVSIYAASLGKNEPISIETVESYFNTKSLSRQKVVRLTPNDIIRVVCNYYNVKPVALRSPIRTERIVLPRQVAMYLIKTNTNLGLQEIADALKRKDHTTVMHAVEKITRMLIRDVNFKQEIDRITQLLTSSA